jgi:crotonobetainyl-CoA:carnitine CoA-transferase CaiB-like acyl-CoA transferase
MQRHAPTLGQHNAELLAEMGFDPAALRAAGAIPAD